MLRSQQLAREIVKVREVVEMFKSGAWKTFMDEVVIPGEQAAFEAYKKIPSNDMAGIHESQVAGKYADIIEAWATKYQRKLADLLAAQQAIHDNKEDDFEIDQATISPEKKIDLRFLNLQRWWKTSRQTI